MCICCFVCTSIQRSDSENNQRVCQCVFLCGCDCNRLWRVIWELTQMLCGQFHIPLSSKLQCVTHSSRLRRPLRVRSPTAALSLSSRSLFQAEWHEIGSIFPSYFPSDLSEESSLCALSERDFSRISILRLKKLQSNRGGFWKALKMVDHSVYENAEGRSLSLGFISWDLEDHGLPLLSQFHFRTFCASFAQPLL